MRCKTLTFSLALAIGLSSAGMTANAVAPAHAAPATTVATTVKAALPAASIKITTKKTTGTMHLRAKATKSSKSLKIVPKNTKLVIKQVSGKWHKVTYKGKTGWVSGKFLKTVSVVTKKTTTAKKKNVSAKPSYRWATTAVNVRKGAGAKHRSIGVISKGTKVTYVSASNGWSKVKTTKGTGWIKSTYLSKSVTKKNTVKAVKIDPRITKINKLIKSKYGSWVYGYGGYRPGSAGHSTGRASDLMIKSYKTKAGKKRGDQVANYLIKNHRQLGVSYLIWNDRIWFTDTGWEDYSDGDRWGKQFTGKWNDTTKHLDHVHVEVWKR